MSAIFGLISLENCPVSEDHLARMSGALTAHGPDACGVWTGESVGFGQRLMCFTPEDRLERQPLLGADGNYILVSDGRLDNRSDLMRELGIPAAEANEMPDSAFIMRSYEAWGTECSNHLVGDFVFALFDRRKEHVFIVRSAMSQRLLFYHATRKVLAFASAPKGLFALPWIPREIDHQSVADYLVFMPRDPGRSMFAGVSELQSGQAMTIGREGFRVYRHWQPDPSRETRFQRDEDYIEAFNDLFERVIESQLRSLTRVGLMMSGGLDSSSVAVIAAPLLPPGKRLAAFTEVPAASFKGKLHKSRYADETPLVQAIAERCANIDLHLVRSDGKLLLHDIDPFLDAAEGPFRAEWNRIWYEAILRQAADQGVRVLLTGAPGNLTVSRNGEKLLPQLIGRGKWIRAFHEARAYAKQNSGSSALGTLVFGALPLLPTPVWLAMGKLLRPNNPIFHARPPWRFYSPIHPEFARVHRVEERARQKGYDFYFRAGRETSAERFENIRRWGSQSQIGPAYQAMFGIQIRNPTGDRRIVEFCLSLPEEQHQHNGVPRSLIRRAVADRLPSPVLANRQRGMQAADWVDRAIAGRSQMFAELAKLERSELGASALDLNWIRELVQELPGFAEGKTRKGIDYRGITGSAFMTGSFIRRFEASSREGTAA